MKKWFGIFLLVLFNGLSYAADSTASSIEAFAGMRNNRYAFLGVDWNKRFGLAVENSVLVQKIELQYVRIAPFYHRELPYGLDVSYTIYAGSRYDKEFYDFGSRLGATFKVHPRFLLLDGIVQPFYDSDMGHNVGYLFEAKSFLLPEVALFANYKNLPEYRALERRVTVGLLFSVNNLAVRPEISTPTDWEMQWTRVSVSFLYRYPI
jgi:hypothetical protein